MPEQASEYRLAELKPEDFIPVPGLDVAVAKTKARAADGEVLTNISWYDTKLLIQSLGSNYLLPTSAVWSIFRELLHQNYPELEKDFITSGEYDKWADLLKPTREVIEFLGSLIYAANEWVDSLLAFPNEKGEYSSRLQIPCIKKGKVPLLIEQSRVERSGNRYVITDGKVTEVPELPLKNGYIQEWNEDLGLPTKVEKNPNEKFEGTYFWVDTDYDYHEGLRAIFRSRWFDTDALYAPSASHLLVGFRLARTLSKK